MTTPLVTGTTNEKVGSYKEVEVNCDDLWSLAQQFAYLRLSEDLDDNLETLEVDLLDSYYARSKRIAATYARLYLETEEGGDPSKKGRYYWMAFGAFASKTVGCVLDHPSVKATFLTGNLVDGAFNQLDKLRDYIRDDDHIDSADYNIISEGLGLGNLWLFMDVAPWHWFNSNFEGQYFDGMACIHKRDAQKLTDVPKKVITENLQWAKYAIRKINNLKPTSYIVDAMKLVKEIEESTDAFERPKLQMAHLQAVANHEQEKILQKLIYTYPSFAHWIKQQRNIWVLNQVSPDYELVYSADCKTDVEKFKSEAPKGVELETLGALDDGIDSKTRMGWIGAAAQDYHELMQDRVHSLHMEEEIKTMAAWVNETDGFGIFTHPSSFE